jgi:diacylglycerol kinase (ATP)
MSTSEKKMMWAGIVANPSAGRGRGLKNVENLEAALISRGVQVELALTPEDRHRIVKLASTQNYDRKVIVAIGGDGTVNALLNECPQVPFCNMASGTENLFARAYRTPTDPDLLADWIIHARSKQMDVGEYYESGTNSNTKKRFALMLGFGFDAAVVNRHHTRRVAQTGSARPTSRLAYVGPLAHEAWYYKFPPVQLTFTDDHGNQIQQVGSTCILFNMDCYAIGLKFVPQASAFDGFLDSVSFSRTGSIQAGIYMATVVAGLHPQLKSVAMGKMREVKVEALESPVPVQMDGDPAGWILPDKPWIVKCIPQACPVLVQP